MTKEQLLFDLTQSRAMLARDCTVIRHELDFKAKAGRLIRRKPWAWLGGAAALGWILAGPKTKTRVIKKTVTASGKKVRTEKSPSASRLGWLAGLLAAVKFATPLLKPILTAYAGKRFASLAANLVK